ncbi:MAG TPA: hypothetical protein VFQ53_23835 [Kofleriaceae bacterium]|nr:hypothetical protein [Kofleriaceae bacterium]
MTRHPTTATWVFPPADRAALPGIERVNLRELVARPERFEHHLVVCARLGDAQLEIVTASEPLYFAHVNISDEYAVALPTGDVMIDLFPLRTFVSDPVTGADVGRYHHRAGDLVLHPVALAHWPGRLRAPYAPLEIPPGMRRCGLSLVYCASVPTPSTAVPVELAPARAADVKPYVDPAPPLALAELAGPPGIVGSIADTTLELVVDPIAIAPPRGGWVIVLEGSAPHGALDLLRLPPGTRLAGVGITRALVLSSRAHAPEPAAWDALPAPPIAPYEDAAPGELPIAVDRLRITERSADRVTVTIDDVARDIPRYWLARMMFRIALHGLRLGYVETYEGLFVDDAEDPIQLGLRTPTARAVVLVPRSEALAVIERLYRAVAPPGYTERLV